RVDPGHEEAERVAERDQNGGVEDDLGPALAAHLETLPAEQGVDQVREDCQRDRQPECIGRRHQTRLSTQSKANAKAKQAAPMAMAERSYMRATVGAPT